MDLGRPIARHSARRPQESGDDHGLRGDRLPAGDSVAKPDSSEHERPTSPHPAPVGRPTR